MGPVTAGSYDPSDEELAMTNAILMLDAYPKDLGDVDKAKLAECIDACVTCSQTCTACADACLAEDMVKDLTDCIRTDLDCADLCDVTGRLLTRRTGHDTDLVFATLQACRTACRLCAQECEKHASRHEHCRICAEACRRCEAACAALIEQMMA